MPSSRRSPKEPAAATRGCLSTRQWADIRSAAALAREQNVDLKVHGVVVFAKDSTRPAGNPQGETKAKPKAPSRTPEGPEPMDTAAEVQPSVQTKKQQRDAQRLADHRDRQRAAPILARWALLARQPCRAARRMIRDAVWTSWRREVLERKTEARRKLYPLLRRGIWQAWTRRCKDVLARKPLPRGAVRRLCGVEALSPLSLRDEYILKRAKALLAAAFPKRCPCVQRSVTGWLHVPYVSDEESNDDLGGSPERRDSPMPSPLRVGSKHASTPKSRCKGKQSRGGGSS